SHAPEGDYEADSASDALDRVTALTVPYAQDAERQEMIPSYHRAGALDKVEINTDLFVRQIAYNAKGQRLLIALGNNVMTRYAYDEKTFRLLRQRSEKYTTTQVGNVVTYAYDSGNVRQDDGYLYDLVGNILGISIRLTDCGVGGTDELDRVFT